MKKALRILALVTVAIILTTGFAFAEGKAKGKNKTPSAAEMVTLQAMVAAANAEIKANVKIAQATPYDDVKWLLKSVDKITKPVFQYAKKIGAEVVCEYDYYVIDGKTVAVDPLKVINIKK